MATRQLGASAAAGGGAASAVMACAGCGRVTSVELYDVLAGVRADAAGEVVWLCARCVDRDGWEDAQRDHAADQALDLRRCGGY